VSDLDAEVTPLELIERTVLEHAKGIRLDLDDDAARGRMRELIGDAVARWSADYRRGLRTHDLADPDLVVERAYRNLVGYGPLESLLEDDDVWEVMINAPDAIFVKRHRGASGYHDEVFHDDEHVIRTLTKILDDASGAHRKLDPTEGLQDAQLDNGARLHIVHGDVARGGHVMVNIRKFTGVAFRELEQLVERDMLSVKAADFLRACARAKLTVVFAGAPGSGKTTLLSCTAAEIDPSLRVVIAEEVFEVLREVGGAGPIVVVPEAVRSHRRIVYGRPDGLPTLTPRNAAWTHHDVGPLTIVLSTLESTAGARPSIRKVLHPDGCPVDL